MELFKRRFPHRIHFIGCLLTFTPSCILFYNGVSSFNLKQWVLLTHIHQLLQFVPFCELVYSQPGESQIGWHPNFLKTEECSSMRENCKRYFNCFSWKALSPIWAHELTKSRRKAWHPASVFDSVFALSHSPCSHLGIQEGQDWSITSLQGGLEENAPFPSRE
jgi:hypothetical protein